MAKIIKDHENPVETVSNSESSIRSEDIWTQGLSICSTQDNSPHLSREGMLDNNSDHFKADFFKLSSECDYDGIINKTPTKVKEVES